MCTIIRRRHTNRTVGFEWTLSVLQFLAVCQLILNQDLRPVRRTFLLDLNHVLRLHICSLFLIKLMRLRGTWSEIEGYLYSMQSWYSELGSVRGKGKDKVCITLFRQFFCIIFYDTLNPVPTLTV